jgi:hypothetical protein
MGWWSSSWWGEADGGGTVYPSFPALANASTPEAIRDRCITVISGLTPTTLSGNKFLAYRNERDGDFLTWCTTNPGAAFRRFQVRDIGTDEPPEVSSVDYEEHRLTLQIYVCYPHTNRTGPQAALDRDDAIDADWKLINFMVGLCGKANFSSPYADATPMGASRDRESGEGCDWLVVTITFIYQRATI